jgi:hypothetical protein
MRSRLSPPPASTARISISPSNSKLSIVFSRCRGFPAFWSVRSSVRVERRRTRRREPGCAGKRRRIG